ncbi:hypothetical protein FA15DRAFT_663705 [Coprinopsis marcescibilis]|uniref:Uncharacterized protein n=1 Tax=Coprinopsis marcescibilis TaxID=230819 RepID=A0A5C3LNK7_COPMA|nr:hypothetical protein FA15DRAFT_663705 [Coprinopsis marcescibilis]
MLSVEFEELGLTLARSAWAADLLASFCTGLQCFMVLYSMTVFFGTPKEARKGRSRYIFASCLLFVVQSVNAFLEVDSVFKLLLQASTGKDLLSPKAWDAEKTVPMLIPSIISSLLLFTLGDGLLLYRCYVVLNNSRWLVIFPTMTYLGAIAFNVHYRVHLLRVISHTVHNHADAIPVPPEGIWIGLGVATNVGITALISYHLLKARKELAKSLPGKSLKVYSGVAYILIEAAVPLTLSGLALAAVTFAQIPQSVPMQHHIRLLAVASVFRVLYYAFTAISPQMVIFRVTTGRSWINAPPRSTREAFSRPLMFAGDVTPEQSFGIQSAEVQQETSSRNADSETQKETA